MRNATKVILLLFILCSEITFAQSNHLGFFDVERDLLIANFDSKPDPDDILAVAALATMLHDHRFENVEFIAVAGAYGIQGGTFIEADHLFDLSFGEHWVNAHSQKATALEMVKEKALEVLKTGGDVWIAEAGQSDFSADLVAMISDANPEIRTKTRIHIVQHSTWNESQTTPEKLLYVREYTDYSKIPDGNSTGNGTPGFNTSDGEWWAAALAHPKTGAIWEEARRIVEEKNGTTGYENPSIKAGGFDFSDTAEAAWIFGFDELPDVSAFFEEFFQKE